MGQGTDTEGPTEAETPVSKAKGRCRAERGNVSRGHVARPVMCRPVAGGGTHLARNPMPPDGCSWDGAWIGNDPGKKNSDGGEGRGRDDLITTKKCED